MKKNKELEVAFIGFLLAFLGFLLVAIEVRDLGRVIMGAGMIVGFIGIGLGWRKIFNGK
ncbi:hypothetical protein [Pleionea mediterranea]|nr:hypothetical protein [Pleionea mediterranea]